jgi:hypothetical protein
VLARALNAATATPAPRVQHKGGDGDLKTLGVFGHAEVDAAHGARSGAQAAAAGVLKGFTRLEQRLVAHDAQALDLFSLALGVAEIQWREISCAGMSPVLVTVIV